MRYKPPRRVTNWIQGLTTTCEPTQPEVEAPEAVF